VLCDLTGLLTTRSAFLVPVLRQADQTFSGGTKGTTRRVHGQTAVMLCRQRWFVHGAAERTLPQRSLRSRRALPRPTSRAIGPLGPPITPDSVSLEPHHG
jgi:hypothetical protein